MEFETFRKIDSYDVWNLKKDEPSAINFLSYRKSKITIELIDEPKEVLIERLEMLLKNNDNFHRKSMIKEEIKKLQNDK